MRDRRVWGKLREERIGEDRRKKEKRREKWRS
jgi:hypothetical protein